MFPETQPKPETCHCLALGQASRHVSQFYDRFLVPAGLRTTQFSILAKPLEREGLIAIAKASSDRRSKELRLTHAGAARLRIAAKGWAEAQAGFETAFGGMRASELRALVRALSATELEADLAEAP
jgi:hypothetical protein